MIPLLHPLLAGLVLVAPPAGSSEADATAPSAPEDSSGPGDGSDAEPEPEPAPEPEREPAPDLLEAYHEPARVRREDERQPGDDDRVGGVPDGTAKVADGEWYLPRTFDEGLADSGLDSWKGPYRAVEARLTMHRFFTGELRGRTGGSVTAQLDVTPNFGIHAGVFFPGNLLIVGGQAFGNNRVRLADFRRIDASLGLVFPEVSVSGVILFDPLEAVLKVQVQVIGLRVVFADLVHVSLRAGAPTVWAALPQLGTAFSWSGSLDVGLNF